MAKYKLVAIDLDDTLLDEELKMSPRARAAVREVRERGVLLTLSSGRMYRAVLPYAEELELNLPLITYQGALVVNSLSGEILQHYPVPLVLAREIIGRVKHLGYHINVYLNDNLYVERKTPESDSYEKTSRVQAHPVGDLLEFLQEDPTKVLIIAEEPRLDQLIEEFKPLYGTDLHITKSKPNFLEFSHPRATKGYALAVLAERYGIRREEVMAIGDSYNDLEMIDFAGLGVIVGNARQEVKKHADYVTKAFAGDGVAEALEKFVLGNSLGFTWDGTTVLER